MGQYNLEMMPTQDATDAIPTAGKSYNALPAPFSACGVFVRSKSAYGLARGMAVDINDGRVSCGRKHNPDNNTAKALIDATGSGQFDSVESDGIYQNVVKLSAIRRSNLLASIMIMPSYFYGVTENRSSHSRGEDGYFASYDYTSSSDTFFTNVFFDWSIDNNYPYAMDHTSVDSTTVYQGEVGLEGFLSAWNATYLSNPILPEVKLESKIMSGSGEVLYRDFLEGRSLSSQPISRTWNFNVLHSSSNVAVLVNRELKSLEEPIPVYNGGVVSGAGVVDPGGDYLVFEDTRTSSQYATAAFRYKYGTIISASQRSYDIYATSPSMSHAVSRTEFANGFTSHSENSNNGETTYQSSSHIAFAHYKKWYSYLFDPHPSFSWQRHTKESQAL